MKRFGLLLLLLAVVMVCGLAGCMPTVGGITFPPDPEIYTTEVTSGTVGVYYEFIFKGNLDDQGPEWIQEGTPEGHQKIPGLYLNENTGRLHGTPKTAGIHPLRICLTWHEDFFDIERPDWVCRDYTVTINPAQ